MSYNIQVGISFANKMESRLLEHIHLAIGHCGELASAIAKMSTTHLELNELIILI